MKRTLMSVLALLMLSVSTLRAEQKVVLVSVDGYRWQELFGGVDTSLVNSGKFGNAEIIMNSYFNGSTVEERRKELMPFTWSHIVNNGVMIGNRNNGCKMDVTNKMWFSYPGHSEYLCGYADDERIQSNDPFPNPNVTVLEMINNDPNYRGSVMAFGSWARFIEIINEQRSGIKVNANYRSSMSEKPTERELFLDKIQKTCPRYWEHERFDFLTHEYAMEALRSHHPKVLFIGYGDTDEWAHAGNYRLYLDAAHSVDSYLEELWSIIQSDPFYKDQTTVLVTCDHGRGDTDINAWRNHGIQTKNSSNTWFLAFGKGIPSKGVISDGQYFECQVAPTIAKILGVEFKPTHKGAGNPIEF